MKDTDLLSYDISKSKNLDHLFITKNVTSGQKIRAYRTKCNITQKELAEVTGITEQNLSSIENDRREVGLQVAGKIAAVFGIDPSFILFPNGIEDVVKKYKSIHTKGSKLIEKKLKKTGS